MSYKHPKHPIHDYWKYDFHFSWILLIFGNMISRIHENTLLKSLRKQPVCVIVGSRQVGKTTLAKKIASKLKKKSIYLDLENPEDLAKLTNGYAYLTNHKDHCVIIDEVQQLPILFTWLRPLIDAHRKPGRFLLLGSANPALVSGVSESLAGRVAYHELPPVLFKEAISSKIKMTKHWFRGGYPSALTAKNEIAFYKWTGDFIKSYVERDLSKFFKVSFSSSQIRNFLLMLAHAHGSIYNASEFGRALGVSNHTAERYAEYLEAAFLIRKLPAWYVYAKKRLVKSPKIYIRDTGILHRLCNIPDQQSLPGYLQIGASWEGYAIEQIIHLLPENYQAYYYRTHQGAECDLVLVTGIKPIACIEIKLSNMPVLSKGYYTCIDDLKTSHNFVITPSSDHYALSKNIYACSLEEYIGKHLKKLK